MDPSAAPAADAVAAPAVQPSSQAAQSEAVEAAMSTPSTVLDDSSSNHNNHANAAAETAGGLQVASADVGADQAAPEAVTAPLAESAIAAAPVPVQASESAPAAPPASTPVFDVGPRHPNDAAPGRITKGGALLTGGYLAHKIYVGNLPERQGSFSFRSCFPLPFPNRVLTPSHASLRALRLLSPLAVLRLPTWKTALARSARASASSSAALALWYGTSDPERAIQPVRAGILTRTRARSQEYADPAHAAEAVAKYNEGHFLGSQIKVELSLARTDLPKESASIYQRIGV